eukprot:5801903-Prorocentrum_lima.AAC.1
MFAKADKPHIKLTKPWWMKHFLHLQGTSLTQSEGRSLCLETQTRKDRSKTQRVVPSNEAQLTPAEIEWSK